MTIIPIMIGAFGTVTKGLLKGLEDLEVGGRVDTIQTTALLKREEKSPGDLRRLTVTQSPVKNHQMSLMWKTLMSSNNDCNNSVPKYLITLTCYFCGSHLYWFWRTSLRTIKQKIILNLMTTCKTSFSKWNSEAWIQLRIEPSSHGKVLFCLSLIHWFSTIWIDSRVRIKSNALVSTHVHTQVCKLVARMNY